MASLPIKLKQNETHPSPQNLPLNFPSKLLLFALLIGVQDYKQLLLPQLLLASNCCLVYLLIDIIFGVCNTVVHAVFKMELEPPSNEPYFATSLQDFWGRRWNLMVTNLLRHTVYRPVKSYLDGVMGPCASVPAVLATFLVSGLMHELLFYRVTLVSPSWEITSFFVLQGVCLAVESAVKRVLAGRLRLRLHPAVAGPLTVGFVMATANWLFFPPLLRAGADERAIEECKMLIRVCKEGLKAGFRRFERLDTWTMIPSP